MNDDLFDVQLENAQLKKENNQLRERNAHLTAEVEKLQKALTNEKGNCFCLYCGQETESCDPDVLCYDCQHDFGHAFYSEL